MMNYILEGKTPKPVEDILQWARWFETADRHVEKTMVEDIRVSNVFLGIDHGWSSEVPILFETMIFGGAHNDFQQRYATWEDAESGHAEAVKLAQSCAAMRNSNFPNGKEIK